MLRLILLLCLCQYSIAQIDSTRLTVVPISDSIQNPILLVFHSMGDIHVKGHQGNQIFAYTQENMPSLSELMGNQNKEEVFTYIDKYQRKISVKQNNYIRIQQTDSLFQIETNALTLNKNLFILAPGRSSVAITIRDLGNIMIQQIQGDVDAQTQTGSIYIEDVSGHVSANTVHGNIISDFSKQKQVKPLFLTALLGNIEVIVPRSSKNSVLVSSEMGNLFTNVEAININASNSSHVKNRKINLDINGGGTKFVLNTLKGDIYLKHLDY